MSCNDDKTYEPCSCGCGGSSDCNCNCNKCAPVNCIEQAINDALATKQDQLEGFVDRAEDAAEKSEAGAAASAASAAESKGYRDEAEVAATTATDAMGTVVGVAETLEDTANKLKQIADELGTAIAGISVVTWYYTAVSDNQTVIPVPAEKNQVDVQAIFIEGARQEPNRGFTYDALNKEITLAEGIPLGLEISIIIGTYSDNPNDFANTLASDNGASLVGTSSGNTVQEELNSLNNAMGDLDTTLRSDLGKNTGAGLVKTESGKTVQQALDALDSRLTPLTPEMYGSAAVTNHTDIFKQMAADAKTLKRPMFAAGNYVLDAHPTAPIVLSTDADFSKATITCTTNDGASTSWGNTSILFKLEQVSTDVTSQFTGVNYARGMKKTSIPGLSGWLGFTSTDVWLQRKANSAAVGSPQYKIEVNETDQNGVLFYPNYFSYTAKPSVAYKPLMQSLEFKMPKIVLDGAGIGWVVFCERNNVDIKGGIISSKNNGFAMSFIEFNKCCRCKLDGYTLDAAFPETYQGGYTVMLTQCSSIELSRLYSISGWSGTDGNYYRGLSVRDSTLLTVGGHCGVSDVFVENCEILNHCNGMGWGTWSAINCHHNLNLDKAAEDFWSTKYDYNNSWDGKVIVRDLKVTLHSACTGHSVVTAMEPKADHSMLGHCPNIVVDGVEYDIANTSPTMDIRTINLGVSGGNNFEQYQVLPQFHTVNDVTFGGGSIRYLNNTNYRVIYNERNYTSLTSDQLNTISRGRYIAKVSNVELERLGRLNQDWLNAARVDGFKFTAYGVKQEIYIDRCAHVIPCTSAWTDMTIAVTNQRMNKGVLDNAVTRTGNTSYNKITFNQCEIFGVGGTAPTYRAGIFDFTGCVFRWDSQSDKQVVSPSTTMGADFGSGAQVVGRIQSSVIAPIPANSAVDSTFKSRVLQSFVNVAVYTTA